MAQHDMNIASIFPVGRFKQCTFSFNTILYEHQDWWCGCRYNGLILQTLGQIV